MAPPVWARSDVSLGTCPKSFITAESITMLEDFAVYRRLGRFDTNVLTARQADGFVFLERLIAREMKNGRQDTRSIT